MSSPFSLFRKHQKTLLVVLIGLSMLSFVIFGTMSQAADFTNMPPTLIVLSIAAFFACIAWVAGIRSHKSGEYGSIGLIAGVALGLVFVMQGGPAPAVTAEGFTLSRTDVEELARTRYVANRFVYHAVDRTSQLPSNELKGMLIQNFSFGFESRNEIPDRDVVLGELLRREAKRIGMSISDAAVTDYINRITDKKMTPELFTEIRHEMQVSERELFDSLRKELLAREVATALYSQVLLPPQLAWEFSKRLQVRQSATVAKVPVEPFLDNLAEPSAAELQKLFDTYRQNQPGFTVEGRPEEGRPGFWQPPRVNLGYVQPDYLAFERLAEKQITDEMIKQRYERDYLAPPESEASPPATGGPALPGQPQPGPQLGPSATPPATPAASPDGEGEKATQPSPQTPANEGESTTPAPATQPAPKESATPEAAPSTETPEPNETPAPAETPEPAPSEDDGSSCDDSAEPPPAEPAPSQTDTAEPPPAEPASSETKPAEPPASSNAEPAETAPNAEQPAPAADAAQPASPGVPPAPADDAPTPNIPGVVGPPGGNESLLDSEPYTPPPLDDQLKMEIRDTLLREKTAQLIEKATADAVEEIRNRIGRDVNAPKDAENKISIKQATELVKKYAAKHNLIYNETGLLTFEQLIESDDHPIGAAAAAQQGDSFQRRTVAEQVFSTSPADLFRPRMVESTGPGGAVEDTYLYWKLAHEEGYIPEDLGEPVIREQVTQTWRELKARDAAEKRARQIAEKVRSSEKPMMELLADETVTGKPDDPVLSLTETGQFSWMRQSVVPSPNPFQRFDIVPQLGSVAGLEEVGEDFMETVFEDLKPGDVGVAPSRDRDYYYVVQVNNRIPSDDEQWDIVRNNFLAGQYSQLEDRMSSELMAANLPNWPEQLMEKYDVRFLQPEPQVDRP
jgi:hypothetical protein